MTILALLVLAPSASAPDAELPVEGPPCIKDGWVDPDCSDPFGCDPLAEGGLDCLVRFLVEGGCAPPRRDILGAEMVAWCHAGLVDALP